MLEFALLRARVIGGGADDRPAVEVDRRRERLETLLTDLGLSLPQGPLSGATTRTWSSVDGLTHLVWLDVPGASGVTESAGSFRAVLGHLYDPMDPSRDDGSPCASPKGWDGRFVAIEAHDRETRVLTDPAGLEAVYARRSEIGALRLVEISNRPSLLADGREPRRERAAQFLAMGATVDGGSLYDGVDRLPPGSLTVLKPDGETTIAVEAIGPDDLRRPTSLDTAAELLTGVICSGLAAFAADPVLQLSGGYDSRLLLAALGRIGERIPSITYALPYLPGYPESEDVELAGRVAAISGVSHRVYDFGRQDMPIDRLDDTSTILRRFGSGVVCISDLNDVYLPIPATVPFIDGVGGELARGGFDHQLGARGELAGATGLDAFVGLYFQRLTQADTVRTLLTPAALEAVRGEVGEHALRVRNQGYSLQEVNEVVFLSFLACWHGSKVSAQSTFRPIFSPLLSRALWPSMLSQSTEDKQRGRFPIDVLELIDSSHRLTIEPYSTRGAHYGGAEGRRALRDWLRHRRAVTKRTGAPGADHEFGRIQAATRDRLDVVRDTFPDLIDDVTVRDVLTPELGVPNRIQRLQASRLLSLALTLGG